MKLLLLMVLLPAIVAGQTVQYPKFTSRIIYYETAKMKILPATKGSFGPEKYKTATVAIENANTDDLAEVSIDIPDVFYITSKFLKVDKYERRIEGGFTISYTIEDGKKLAILYLVYDSNFNENPLFINVTAIENINITPVKSITYMLYDFKKN